MKRVAVFGNAGGGKSTLARKLAELTKLPLHALDMLQYRAGGVPVPVEEYRRAHDEVLQQEAWIIDGYGSRETAWQRFAAADTLIYVDLPLATHALWVTKRLVQGLWRTPEGWPEGSPIIRSSLSSYRVLWLCHRHLTPRYRELVQQAQPHKRVHHLRSRRDIAAFLSAAAAAGQPPTSRPER